MSTSQILATLGNIYSVCDTTFGIILFLRSADDISDQPRLKPITQAWLRGASIFPKRPHPGCPDPDGFRELIDVTNASIEPPLNQVLEETAADEWLRVRGPTDESFSAYSQWIESKGDKVFSYWPRRFPPGKSLPAAAHLALNPIDDLGFDDDVLEFLSLREMAQATVPPGGRGGESSAVLEEVVAFDGTIRIRMGQLFLERHRLRKRWMSLVDMIAIYNSIITDF